jgi:glycerol kinase
MLSGLILAIDQGTTNTKALLIGRQGDPVFRASVPVALIVDAHGHVGQAPDALWDSVRRAVAECVQYATQTGHPIDAVAISNQRETAVAWNAETGAPLADAISWQCGRSAPICRRLEAHRDAIRVKTGLPLATLISAGKWAWLLENNEAVQACAKTGTLRLGTVDSWLVHQFTGSASHATDLSNASRTGLLNLERIAWDPELLNLFGIPLASLPELRSSCGSFEICRGIPGLEGVSILAVIGDSHAALFGHGCYTPGTVKATYGTGSSLMALTPALAMDTPSLARTIAWSIDGHTQFALEGNIAMTGSAVQWVGAFLNLGDPAQEAAILASSVSDANGVYFVPAMVGLGAPHWDTMARGTISGLGRSHTSAHLARAAIDAIAYQVADVFLSMQETADLPFSVLHADGGATRNTALMQFQADILGQPVLRSVNEELSAIGASLLAGLELGWWADLAEIAGLPRAIDQFAPAMNVLERDRLYCGWKTAVKRARLTTETGA